MDSPVPISWPISVAFWASQRMQGHFGPQKRVTPYLPGLIYAQRLLSLDYALPFRAYKHLGIDRRPRRGHLERLDEIRLRYMAAGSLTPLGEFQSLRDFGTGHFPDQPTFFSLLME
jgi:hypothetical protein